MKKSTFLKLALVTVAIFMFAGLKAQINHTDDPATGTNYVAVGANQTYQTVNLGFRLYAYPDAAYNAAYDGTGAAGTGLSANSRWTWRYGVDFATGLPVKAAANENWVDLVVGTLPAAGASRTYWVVESNTLIACTDVGISHVVNVTGEPTSTLAGVGGAGWTTIAANDFRRCASGADIGDALNLSITETGSVLAAQSYTFGISVTQWELDETLIAVPASNVDVTGAYGKTANTAALVAGLTPSHTIPALPLKAAGVPTRYDFTITANSITSMISLRSHLRNGIANAGYSGAATTISYTLLPVPTTGPIYHIPNAF